MKKRILFIHNELGWGGTEKVLMTILKHFDYSKFNVDLLLVYNNGSYLSALPNKIKIRRLYSKFSSFLEKINYNLLSRFGLDLGYRFLMYLKTPQKYDVIISFAGGTPLKYHNYVRSKALKNISWMHTDLFTFHYTIGPFFTESQEKEAYSKMDKIVFVSNDAKKQFEKLYPEVATSKEVILNPIEKNLIVQYRKEYKKYSVDRCFNIVSVGRLSSKEKAFDRLVRLAKRLKDDNYNFNINIIGEGEHRQELERLIVENGVENNVFLLGFIDSPYEEMSKADLFVLPSIVEGFALVLAEAFCLGLPVVSTKTAGPIELINNNEYGLLAEHDDESIYLAVKKMMDDDFLREYYHRKSLERAEMLNVDEVMNSVYNLLH